jgi:RND family efflux transporter MFP subunit
MIDLVKIRFAFLGVVFLLLNTSCGEEREVYKVKSGDIVESVYSSVSLEPKGMYLINAIVAGHIDEVFVKPGDTVKKGDVLFTIVDVQSSANSQNAKLAYDLAKKSYSGEINIVDDLELELNSAGLKRRNDSLNFSRNAELFANGAITSVEFESSELQFKASQNTHELIKKRINRTKAELRTSLEQAKNTYASSLSRTSDAVIRSEIDGIVYEVYKEEGELVMSQETLSVIGSSDEYVIKMKVDEVDITRVHVGQKIYIHLEAYRGKVFEGKVTHITPKMDERTQTFALDGAFIEAPEKLYLGLTGEGNIVVKERSGAVMIPLTYLIEQDEVETPDGIKKIELGARSLNEAEVLSGLSEGASIYKPE